MAQEPTCSDCSSVLEEIRIVDKTTVSGGGHFDLEYTVPETARSFWDQKYPVAGRVAALMCPKCGRIKLYGRPSADS
jgi:hypothetical protein